MTLAKPERAPVKHIVRVLPIAILLALGACHTDPFGLKPEVRGVEIPEKPSEPAEAETEEKETPAPETPA
jgi:hypothetical protein